MKYVNKECGVMFVIGAVAGLVGLHVGKQEKTREFAVKSLAKGILVKETVMEEYTNIREEAEDICQEARDLAKEKSQESN